MSAASFAPAQTRRIRLPRVSLPGAAWACALVALANAVAWSLITPPFNVPDEPPHLAYVQQLAERGTLPRTQAVTIYPANASVALAGTHLFTLVGVPQNRPIWTSYEDRALEHGLSKPLARTGNGDANVATAQPPLYYALQAIPYEIGSGGNLLDQLALMRLLSTLMAGLTALFAFLFLREVLPGTPWAWTVGGLAVAFQPLFGFISSGVNNDALLFCASAAMLAALARIFRRGLTVPRAGALGAAVAVGVLTKLTFVGLIPGAAAGMALAAWRDRNGSWPALSRALAVAVGIAAVPIAAYLVLNVTVWHRPALGSSVIGSIAQGQTTPGHAPGGAGTFRGFLSYLWQFYLPPLPSMFHYFTGLPLKHFWVHGFIGRFGWLDYGFPDAVYAVGTWLLVAIAALAAAGLWRARAALRARLPELAAYVLVVLGLVVVIARAGWHARVNGDPPFEQARYLLPLLALYGAIVALAARSAGRRWGPVLGAALVGLAFAHDVFAQLVTFGRYYA